VRFWQDPVTPTEKLFQVSMDIVLSRHEPHWNKESNHQIVKRKTRRWWGFARGISNARWETKDMSRRQSVTKFKGDIVPSHSGSRGETVSMSRMTWLQKQCCVKRSYVNMTLYYEVTFSKKPWQCQVGNKKSDKETVSQRCRMKFCQESKYWGVKIC